MMDPLVDASAWVIPVVLAVTLHEAAHGWMAEKFGDDTARRLGRVTFNPFKHIHHIGTIILPGLLFLLHSPFIFGYAKPVPVDFRRLRPPRLGMFMVALAGPGTNVLLALVSGLLLHIDALTTPEQSPWIFLNLYRSIMINCVLAIFNMIPILPLDGGRVVDSLISGPAKRFFDSFERWGILIVLLLMLMPAYFGYDFFQQVMGPPVGWLVDHILMLTGNGETMSG